MDLRSRRSTRKKVEDRPKDAAKKKTDKSRDTTVPTTKTTTITGSTPSPKHTSTSATQPETTHSTETQDNENKEASATAGTSGNQSPDPNCSICLGKLDNKSFTDSCFHMFCFTCLLEWSKVKAECPLCKQSFKSIIHNVRSYEDYDQYNVADHARPPPPPPASFMDTMFDNRRFRYRTTFTLERLMEAHYREQQHQLWSLHLRPTSTVTTRLQDSSRRQAVTTDFRRRVYQNHLKVSKFDKRRSSRRVRDIRPEFFTSNPSSVHRLVPWLNREINALLDNQENHVQFILELIMDLIKRFTIDSEEFYQHVRPFIGSRTRHFIHEFVNFARSPYDMIAYDSHAIYEHRNDTTISNSNSDNSSDSDVIVISPSNDNQRNNQARVPHVPRLERPPRVRRRRWNTPPSQTAATNHDLRFSPVPDTSIDVGLNRMESLLQGTTDASLLPGHSAWDDMTPSVMWPDSRLSLFPAATSTISALDLTMSARPSTQSRPVICDSDSSGEVEIVKVEKPYRDRTPIILSSDSDGVEITKEIPAKKLKKHKIRNLNGSDRLYVSSSSRPSSLRRRRSSSSDYTDRLSHGHSSKSKSHKNRTRQRSRSRSRHRDGSHENDRNKHQNSRNSRIDSVCEKLREIQDSMKSSHKRYRTSTSGDRLKISLTTRHNDRSSSGEPKQKSHKSHKKHKHSKHRSSETSKKSRKHKKKHKHRKSKKSDSHKSDSKSKNNKETENSPVSVASTSSSSTNVTSVSSHLISNRLSLSPLLSFINKTTKPTVISDSDDSTVRNTLKSPLLNVHSDGSDETECGDYVDLLGSPTISAVPTTSYKLPDFGQLISDVTSNRLPPDDIIDIDLVSDAADNMPGPSREIEDEESGVRYKKHNSGHKKSSGKKSSVKESQSGSTNDRETLDTHMHSRSLLNTQSAVYHGTEVSRGSGENIDVHDGVSATMTGLIDEVVRGTSEKTNEVRGTREKVKASSHDVPLVDTIPGDKHSGRQTRIDASDHHRNVHSLMSLLWCNGDGTRHSRNDEHGKVEGASEQPLKHDVEEQKIVNERRVSDVEKHKQSFRNYMRGLSSASGGSDNDVSLRSLLTSGDDDCGPFEGYGNHSKHCKRLRLRMDSSDDGSQDSVYNVVKSGGLLGESCVSTLELKGSGALVEGGVSTSLDLKGTGALGEGGVSTSESEG